MQHITIGKCWTGQGWVPRGLLPFLFELLKKLLLKLPSNIRQIWVTKITSVPPEEGCIGNKWVSFNVMIMFMFTVEDWRSICWYFQQQLIFMLLVRFQCRKDSSKKTYSFKVIFHQRKFCLWVNWCILHLNYIECINSSAYQKHKNWLTWTLGDNRMILRAPCMASNTCCNA